LAYSLSELPVSKEFISGTPHTLDVSSTSGVQEAIDTESPHPYPNDYDNTWVVMRQDATRIRVHFNYISTEHNYDYVYIKDNGGSVSATYSGIYDHMWSAWVSGDTLKIQLDSDWSGAGNGFAIDGVEWESTGTRYEFTSWGDGATSTSRTMTADAGGPATYTANYATQCYLTVQSEQGDPQGGGWYDKGVTAPFSVTSFVDQGNGTGYAFTCWSGDSNGTSSISSVVMGSPKTVTANWNVQYRLTVNSQWGAPQGAGWYDSGATAAFSVSPLIDQGSATRYAFTNWSGDSTETSNSSSIVMDSPKVVTANWKLQYYLTVQPDRGNPQGSEWYDAGREATISVRSPIGTIIRRVFSGWSGDSTVSTKTATIVMDSPKSVIADWRTDYARLYILIIGILLAFGLAGAVTVLVRRRQVYAPVPVKEAEATTAIERAPEQQTVQNTTNEKPQQEAEQVGCPLCGSTDVFEEAGIRRCGGCCIILPR
jgi:uncharacterized repeat protein (TIGR02543 family)